MLEVAGPRGLREGAPPFALDRGDLCLWRGGERVELTPKSFEVLDFLRRNPKRLVSHDEILDAVWPGTYVQPEIVKTYMRTLRRLLRDDVRAPRFIETRPRRGYRFIGDIPDRIMDPGGERSRLVGRETEMGRLRAALRSATDGRRALIAITAESGIGKSALLDAFKQEAASRERTIVATAYGCRGLVDAGPLSTVTTLLQSAGVTLGGERYRSCLEAFGPAWLGPEQGLGVHAKPSAQSCPPPTGPLSLDRLAREACRVFECFAADERTLVLAIDDLQWCDAASLELLGTLVRRRDFARLLVVGCYRRVEFLSDCPVRDLISDATLRGFGEELALSAAPSAGFLPVERRRDLDVGPIASPSSLRLQAQMRDLQPLVRSALEAGSIAGKRFCAWSVSRILDTEEAEIEDLLSRLAESCQFVTEAGLYALPDGAVSPRFSFESAALHGLLLSGQAPSRRIARHRKLGHAIEAFWAGDIHLVAADMCGRFEHAGDWDRAIGYARMAASEAVDRSSGQEAKRLLARALRLASKLPAHHRVAVETPLRRDLSELDGASPSRTRLVRAA